MSGTTSLRLAEWVTAQREHVLSEADHATLDALLRDRAEVRRRYIVLAMIDMSCHRRFAAAGGEDIAMPRPAPGPGADLSDRAATVICNPVSGVKYGIALHKENKERA